MTTFNNQQLSAINIGEAALSRAMSQNLISNTHGIRYNDALHILLPGGEVWAFDYGVLVFWAVDFEERTALYQRLQINDQIDGFRQEHFRFALNATETRISRDIITLADDNPLTRLAISHALAQSLKLVEYELQAQQTIQKYSDIPETLAATGRIAIKRRDIAKIRGYLFSTKSDIILNYGLLDTPEFFWEYPEYEPVYNVAARYLEIHPRINLLSKKLETIHELFEMLADEQKHQHSASLEWIIIVLIAIEILIFGAQELHRLWQ